VKKLSLIEAAEGLHMKLKAAFSDTSRKVEGASAPAFIRRDNGFSLVEVSVGIMLAIAIAGFALIQMEAIMPGTHANQAMNLTLAQLRRGRDLAITQRRPILLQFQDNNKIRLVRSELDETTTMLSTVTFGNKCQFIKFDEIEEDTPDTFGNNSAIDFGGANTLTFFPDGTLVDDSLVPINGSIFLGLPEHPEVARAVTILGATGRVRCYRWTGEEWIQ
jgi:Tfp pilus assembly protein FimT